MSASIVITSHNYGEHLAKAIESALGQSVPASEVVVVDDGSTDDSPEVARRFGDQIILLEQENLGQVAACATGLPHTTAEWVIFLDADDLLDPTAVATLLEHAQPGASRVQWPMRIIDLAGRETGERIPGVPMDTGAASRDTKAFGPGAYVCAPSSGNAWSRSFLEQVMPLPPGFAGGVDALLNDLCPLFGGVTSLSEPGGSYLRHDAGNSGRKAEWSTQNLLAVSRESSFRRTLLEGTARRIGVTVDPVSWRSTNWRLAVVDARLGRLGAGDSWTVRDQLASAAKIPRSAVAARKWAVTTAALLLASALPLRAIDALAPRVVQLRHL